MLRAPPMMGRDSKISTAKPALASLAAAAIPAGPAPTIAMVCGFGMGGGWISSCSW